MLSLIPLTNCVYVCVCWYTVFTSVCPSSCLTFCFLLGVSNKPCLLIFIILPGKWGLAFHISCLEPSQGIWIWFHYIAQWCVLCYNGSSWIFHLHMSTTPPPSYIDLYLLFYSLLIECCCCCFFCFFFCFFFLNSLSKLMKLPLFRI